MKPLAKPLNTLFLICSIIIAAGASARGQTLSYDFETDFQGWLCDFADYNVGDSAIWHLSYKRDTMPQIRPVQYGIAMRGDNFSDDLFFFTKRKITGLSANAAYKIAYSIDIVTNMPPDGVGGGDLILKAGATIIEPAKIVSSGMYRMNINKSNQSQPGPDMDTLGHINHTAPGNRSYHLVTFTNANHLFQRTANTNGEMWLVVGAESAFEVPNVEFLVAKISATLTTSSTGAVPASLPTGRSEISVFSKPAAPGILYVNASPDLLPVEDARLFSLTGQEMALTMPAANSIDIGNLKKGVYVLMVSTQKGTEHREILITR
jgi:hypothetical protein